MTNRLPIILATGVLAACFAFAVRMTVLEARARREAQQAPPADAIEWTKAWLNGPADYEGPLPDPTGIPVEATTMAEFVPPEFRPLYEVRLTAEESDAMMAFANAFHANRQEGLQRGSRAIREARRSHGEVLATLRQVTSDQLGSSWSQRTLGVGLRDEGVFATARLAEVSAMDAHLEGRDDEALAYLRDVSRLAVLLATEGGIGEASVASWALLCTSPTLAPILADHNSTTTDLRTHIEAQNELRSRMGGDALPTVLEEHARAFRDLPYLTSEQAEWMRQCFQALADEVRKPRAYRNFGGVVSDAYASAGEIQGTRLMAEVPDGLSVTNTWDILTARLLGEEVLAALELYRMERGAYPVALADLVPLYLTESPLDPFADGPLRYSAVDETVLLYSVGLDGDDDGGIRDYRASEYPDLVFAGGVVTSEPTAGVL